MPRNGRTDSDADGGPAFAIAADASGFPLDSSPPEITGPSLDESHPASVGITGSVGTTVDDSAFDALVYWEWLHRQAAPATSVAPNPKSNLPGTGAAAKAVQSNVATPLG